MNKKVAYIWERGGWPGLQFQMAPLQQRLMEVREARAALLATVRVMEGVAHLQAAVETMTQEVVGSSAIEGVNLSLEAVRDSLMLRLGGELGGLPHRGVRRVDPVVGILVDAVQGWEQPLTLERIFGWHHDLFRDGFSRHLGEIRVGEFRGDEPMVVVSSSKRPGSPQKIHFEAPPRVRLEQEMHDFLTWFNHPPAGMDGLIRSGIAHFWFVTIHPFEDGNGRLARTIGDLALAQADRSRLRFYSVSGQIMRSKGTYYDALERAQHGGLDITDFLAWFLDELLQAMRSGLLEAYRVMARVHFWHAAEKVRLNERQKKALRKALGPRFDGDSEEDGTLSNRYYRVLNPEVSRVTAARDLGELVELGLLEPHGSGRGAAYRVPLERHLSGNLDEIISSLMRDLSRS